MRPITPVAYRQFPIRLDSTVMDELDLLSTQTRVPKSKLARDALLVMMAKLKATGAAKRINDTLSV